MKHELAARDGPGYSLITLDVALDDLGLAIQYLEVSSPAGREVVEYPNRMPTVKKSHREMRADESAATGHENLCHQPKHTDLVEGG